MNVYMKKLNTLYTETPENIAMEKAMSEEWDLLNSMYVRNFLQTEQAVAVAVPQAPTACSIVG
jgi:hypothetical protein